MRAIVASVAVLVCACSTAPVSAPSPSVTTAPSMSAGPSVTATPATIATPTPPLTPRPITDVAHAFTAMGPWRPTGTTIVVTSIGDAGLTATLVAITLGPSGRVGAPTPIVKFQLAPWSIRNDGSAVALTVLTRSGTRIAIWDARTATGRWLTSVVPTKQQSAPIWSLDGASLFYAESDDQDSPSIFQIGADGTGKRLVTGPIDRMSAPTRLTPDGKGLVWSLGQAGGSVEILDVATGVTRHIENVAGLAAWRPQQPRLLLNVGGCCAGRPGGSLVAFDDEKLTSTVVAARGPSGDPAWGGSAWDPTGTRIAAGRYDSSSPYDATLVLLDPRTGLAQPIAGTEGTGSVQWLPEGILFGVLRYRQPGGAVMFLPNGASTPVVLQSAIDFFPSPVVVRP